MSSNAVKYFHLMTSAAPPPWMQDNRAPQYLQLLSLSVYHVMIMMSQILVK